MTEDDIYVERKYYDSGDLWCETPYVNGEKNGIEKIYYERSEPWLESVELWRETPYVDGKKNALRENIMNQDSLNLKLHIKMARKMALRNTIIDLENLCGKLHM